jgi:hypothetical protein
MKKQLNARKQLEQLIREEMQRVLEAGNQSSKYYAFQEGAGLVTKGVGLMLKQADQIKDPQAKKMVEAVNKALGDLLKYLNQYRGQTVY